MIAVITAGQAALVTARHEEINFYTKGPKSKRYDRSHFSSSTIRRPVTASTAAIIAMVTAAKAAIIEARHREILTCRLTG